MAHEVHTTKAIVLSSANVQDADKLLWLLTEDFGLLFASAKSVREEVSKLRYSLQDLSFIRVSLVKGKGLWRVTGAELDNTFNQHPNIEKQEVFGRITSLVRRLSPKEEKNKDFFDTIANARLALYRNEYDKEIIETITVARILHQLGYFPYKNGDSNFITGTTFSQDMMIGVNRIKKEIHQKINQSLVTSQL